MYNIYFLKNNCNLFFYFYVLIKNDIKIKSGDKKSHFLPNHTSEMVIFSNIKIPLNEKIICLEKLMENVFEGVSFVT